MVVWCKHTCVTPASVVNGVAQALSKVNGLDPVMISCQITIPAELAMFSFGFKVPEEISDEVVKSLEKYKDAPGGNFDLQTRAYIDMCGKKFTPEHPAKVATDESAGVGESKSGSNDDEDEDDDDVEVEGCPVASDEQGKRLCTKRGGI